MSKLDEWVDETERAYCDFRGIRTGSQMPLALELIRLMKAWIQNPRVRHDGWDDLMLTQARANVEKRDGPT